MIALILYSITVYILIGILLLGDIVNRVIEYKSATIGEICISLFFMPSIIALLIKKYILDKEIKWGNKK